MSNILKGLNEGRSYGRDSWDSNMPGYQGDYGGAENFGRRKREWDEDDRIDARIRAEYEQKKQYEQNGKFWLKLKDSQRHLPAGPFVGKQSANQAAIDLLKQQPELKGNLVITAYGPDEQVNELSNNTLASYKKKAGADASAADKAGDYKRGDKRFSGIVKATKKQFANDAKGVAEGWREEAEDMGEWAEYVRTKLMSTPEQQRYSVAQQLSRIEVKNFGSELVTSQNFDPKTGKPKPGRETGLTKIVKDTLRALTKPQGITAAGYVNLTPGPQEIDKPDDRGGRDWVVDTNMGWLVVPDAGNAPGRVKRLLYTAFTWGPEIYPYAIERFQETGDFTEQDLRDLRAEAAERQRGERLEETGSATPMLKVGDEIMWKPLNAKMTPIAATVIAVDAEKLKIKIYSPRMIQMRNGNDTMVVALANSEITPKQITTESENPYGYEVGQTVKLDNGQQGRVIDIFDDSIEVLLVGGRTVTVDFRDAQVIDEDAVAEDQLDELKCWPGYTRVRGVPAGAPGSCKKKTNEEGVAEGLDQPREAGKAIQSLKNLAIMKSALTMQQLSQAGRESIVTNAINAAKTLEQSYMANKQQGNAVFVRALRDEIDNFRRGAPINASFPESDNASELGDLLQGKLSKINFQQSVAEEQHSCPHCGGEMVSEELMNEKKDACYYKVKSRYKVWPSAYASGALVKCRKKGADNWGTGGKKNESSILEGIEQVDENLNKWFKEKWVRFGPDGKIRGDCARGDDSEGKPKCLPQSKAHSLGKKGRASAAARKRREDPNPERSGKAINVNTKKKSNEGVAEAEKNPHTSALGKALYRDLSKEKKASPAQVQRNKERWAKRQAEREQGVAEAELDEAKIASTEEAEDFFRNGKKVGSITKVTLKSGIIFYRVQVGNSYKIGADTRQEALRDLKRLLRDQQGVAEGYQFKGPFPFDVDHMHGGRGINLPKAETKKYFTDKKQWQRAVDDINSSKYDDNSDYIGVTGRSTVEINGREWARWSDAQQKGYIELSSMSEQGVAEAHLDEKWSQKYKDSINCSNPKGFSQKAHCQGKNK